MTVHAGDVGELRGYVSRETAHRGHFNLSLLFKLLAPNTGGVLYLGGIIGKLGYIDRTIPYPRWVSKNPCPSPSGGGQGFF